MIILKAILCVNRNGTRIKNKKKEEEEKRARNKQGTLDGLIQRTMAMMLFLPARHKQ